VRATHCASHHAALYRLPTATIHHCGAVLDLVSYVSRHHEIATQQHYWAAKSGVIRIVVG
jgi:hypothetical protein